MTPQLRIQIPEPCHQLWQDMTFISQNTRHCTSCDQVVTDFTAMSDEELIDFFENNNRKLCGYFTSSQLNRVIVVPEQKRNLKFSFLFPFLFTGFFLGAKPNETKKISNAISIVEETKKRKVIRICGDIKLATTDTTSSPYWGLIEITNGRDTFSVFSRNGEYKVDVNCFETDSLMFTVYETSYVFTIKDIGTSNLLQHDILLYQNQIEFLSRSVSQYNLPDSEIKVAGDLDVMYYQKKKFPLRVSSFFRKVFKSKLTSSK